MVMSKPALPEDKFRVQKWFDEKAGSVSISIPSTHSQSSVNICGIQCLLVNTTVVFVIVFHFPG